MHELIAREGKSDTPENSSMWTASRFKAREGNKNSWELWRTKPYDGCIGSYPHIR